MTRPAPVVYLLHGDDEFAIAQFVLSFEAKLGDAAMAAMNVTRLDGLTYHPDQLLSTVSAMPFLSNRRLVVLTNPLNKLTSPAAREKFKETLERVPATTDLILIEPRVLTEEKVRRGGNLEKFHWLERWVLQHPERAQNKIMALPRGMAMVGWIQNQAKKHGGSLTPDAAEHLARLVGDEPRLADQEIQKLLAYVNYRRVVEIDDVDSLVADTAQGNVFELVDALGNRNGRAAMAMLQRLLDQQDAFSLFGMIVRQFRLILLAREVLDSGGSEFDVTRDLKIQKYVSGKVVVQARRFSLPVLEGIMHRLLDLDTAVKSGQMEMSLALETLVAALTAQEA